MKTKTILFALLCVCSWHAWADTDETIMVGGLQVNRFATHLTFSDVLLSNQVTGNTKLGNDFSFVDTICEDVPEGNIYYVANGNLLKKLER